MRSQYSIGKVYREGRGVPQNVGQGMDWVEKPPNKDMQPLSL